MKLRLTDKSRAYALTQREWQVIGHMATGLSTKVIGGELGLHPNTVSYHLQNIYRKTQLTNPVELCRFAIRIGLIEP